MAETDPKTVQDLTSVVRAVCVGPRPWHPGAAQASEARGPGRLPRGRGGAWSLEAEFLKASPAEASGHLDPRPPGPLGVGPCAR